MSVRALELLREQIGKELANSPSAVAMWLKPVFVKVEKGDLVAQYTVRKEMTNAVGNLHGGMISCIIDDLMGTAVFTLDRENFMTTVNLSIDFLYGAKLGDVLEGHCKVIREGKNIVNVTCQIYDSRKNLIASGTSNLATTSVKKEM